MVAGRQSCAVQSPSSSSSSVAPASASESASTPAHYENFPVASWLCPPALRQPIAAIYGFARTADDIADEGAATPTERLALLCEFRAHLFQAALGRVDAGRWPQVFAPLAQAIERHRLPEALLADLLDAFVQDIEYTRHGRHYRDRAELLDYCRRSANPVGRLLLHLYGVGDAESLARSDAICSALQLINFWQDLSVDLPRRRFYLPTSDLGLHDLDAGSLSQFRPLAAAPPPAAALALVAHEVEWARGLMQRGAPLVHRLPGRAGWELRLVVQGGLRILDKIEALGFDSFSTRPTIGKPDVIRMSWAALWMRRQSPAMTSPHR
ncbi:Squalene synthase HpnC [Burkholderiales bacterium 8X]|nr:Squalene synthase HpnC [Burkholderiales bacterium 8X]